MMEYFFLCYIEHTSRYITKAEHLMSPGTLRTQERFDVNLDAIYEIKGHDMMQKECQIANLNSIGARVYFSQNESFTSGAVIAMDIPIPNTVMRIEAEAEIIWTRLRFNELICGIKFTGALSDSMIRKFVNKTSRLSDYTELIW
jgi:hypothetical protein